jgi:hypothetical protein
MVDDDCRSMGRIDGGCDVSIVRIEKGNARLTSKERKAQSHYYLLRDLFPVSSVLTGGETGG